MSTLKTTNIAHPSSASNNIVLDSSGGVDMDAFTVDGSAPADSVNLDASGRLLVGTSTNIRGGVIQAARATADTEIQIIESSDSGEGPKFSLTRTRGSNLASPSAIQDGNVLGKISFSSWDTAAYREGATISAFADGQTWASGDCPARLVFSTTADGASSPTERMRIFSTGQIIMNARAENSTDVILIIGNTSGNDVIFEASNSSPTAISGAMRISKNASNSRSINAAGTVNQNGADYAEYFKKCGNFVIQKADVVGINSSGLLTNIFADAISFCVKSTDPGLVGGDNWFTEPRPKGEDGQEVDSSTPEYAEWMARLELARATVDRIAFAGQVPVNVIGATPGQYIVPVETEDGGITGIAKDGADLTLTEYMRAVGKVIAIEDDGRARIIVKVA